MTRHGPRRMLVAAGSVLVVALAVGGVWLGGGFADAKEVSTPTAPVETAVVGDLVRVTVHDDAELLQRLPGQNFDAPDGKSYLVVHATVENTDDEWWITPIGELRATLGTLLDQNDRPDIDDSRDSRVMPAYNPGVPMEVAYVWTVASDAVRDGQRFWVGVYQHKHRLDDPVFGSSSPTGPLAMAIVDLTVEDRR